MKSRVFIGVTEVAGFYRALKFGFDQLGLPCTYMNIVGHRFQYGGDNWKIVTSWVRKSAQKKSKFWRVCNLLLRTLLFVRALVLHDVFIFGFNSSFFKNYIDLPILKFFGKKIVYQFHGSDGRPPYMDGSVMAPARGRSILDCIKLTQRKKNIIRTIDQYADVIINTPPQGIFHERPFILWMRVGVAVLPPEDVIAISKHPTQKVPLTHKVTILHCPSDPEAKGSYSIREIINTLKQKGLEIDYQELTNQPNEVVCQALATCDIVLDQCYADYGMPGFATEAAWYGKPVVIAGYAVDLWKSILPKDSLPPTAYCHPDALEATLEELIRNQHTREALGQRARHFVETQWHPKLIAQRYLQLLDGDIPSDWIYHPTDIRYWQGCCLSEARARQLIGDVINTGGEESLQLADKPALRQLLLQVSQQEPAQCDEMPVHRHNTIAASEPALLRS